MKQMAWSVGLLVGALVLTLGLMMADSARQGEQLRRRTEQLTALRVELSEARRERDAAEGKLALRTRERDALQETMEKLARQVSAEVEPTGEPTPTSTPMPTPTVTATPTPTPTSTPSPSPSPTATPSPTPTVAPTPTASPSPSPTPSPSPALPFHRPMWKTPDTNVHQNVAK